MSQDETINTNNLSPLGPGSEDNCGTVLERAEPKLHKHRRKFQHCCAYDFVKVPMRQRAKKKLPQQIFCPIVNDIDDLKLPHDSSRLNNLHDAQYLTDDKRGSGKLVFEKLDTVRSGESLVKYYNFDTSKYNSSTDKCVAFWAAIMEAGIEPAKCIPIKLASPKREEPVQENDEEYDSCLWYNTLLELQSKKMDEVALAASTEQCKLCGREEPYSEFKKRQSQKYSENELQDNEDIILLNSWQSKPKPLLVDAATDVQNAESLEALPRPASTSKREHPETGGASVASIPKFKPSVSDQMPEALCSLCQCGSPGCRCRGIDFSNLRTAIAIAAEEHLKNFRNLIENNKQKKEKSEPPPSITTPRMENQEMTTDNKQETELLWSATMSRMENQEVTTDKMQESGTTSTHKDLKTSTTIENEIDVESTAASAEDDIESLTTNSKCRVCNKIYCQCKSHLDEEDRRFLDQFKHQLRNIRKDKSCVTDEVEEKKTPEKHLCIICGHDDCNCRDTTEKTQKYFEFIRLMDDEEPFTKQSGRSESQTEAEKISQSHLQKSISGHLRKSVCEKIVPESASIGVPQGSSTTEKSSRSYSTKRILIAQEQGAAVEPNSRYGIPLVKQAGRYAPSTAIASDDAVSDSPKIETIKSNEATERKWQGPMLWYCSDMPQRNEAPSLSPTGKKL